MDQPLNSPEEVAVAAPAPMTPAPGNATSQFLQKAELYSVMAQSLAAVFKAANIQIPGQLEDQLVKISSVIGALSAGYHDPTSIEADLGDIETALKAVEQVAPAGLRLPVIGGDLESMLKSVTATRAGLANLAGGQFALIGTLSVSIGGVEQRVVVGALLQDSELAKQLLGL